MAKNFEHVIKTDVGLVRKANEDSAGFAPSEELQNNGDLIIVCDGMGGHVGGATASQMAVKNFIEFFSREYYPNPIIALHNAIVFANEQIYARAQVETELKGMGTTCTLALIRGDEAFIGHVGDSRIYLKTEEKLHRITKDHSFVQQLVDQGIIKDEEAEDHPRKNEILRALGIRESVEPEVAASPVLPKEGDVFLLCTDGLNGLVPDATMFEITNQGTSLDEQGDRLINLAKDAGGHDNITVALVKIISSPHQASVFIDLSPGEQLEITGNMHTTEMTQEMNLVPPKKSIWKRPVLYVFCGVAVICGTLLSIGIKYFVGGDYTQPIGSEDPVVTTVPGSICTDTMFVHLIKAGEDAGTICRELEQKADTMYFKSCFRYVEGDEVKKSGDAVTDIEMLKPGDIIKLDCECIDQEIKRRQRIPVGIEKRDSEDDHSTENNTHSTTSGSTSSGTNTSSTSVQISTSISVGTDEDTNFHIEGSIKTTDNKVISTKTTDEDSETESEPLPPSTPNVDTTGVKNDTTENHR
jgi:serine/threonine protein phosphatase PrpC